MVVDVVVVVGGEDEVERVLIDRVVFALFALRWTLLDCFSHSGLWTPYTRYNYVVTLLTSILYTLYSG